MNPLSQRQHSASGSASVSVHAAKVCKSKNRSSSAGITKAKSDMDDTEILFRKLVQMIPSLPKDQKLSKLRILQAVIDYIQELERRLESHPDSENICTGLTKLKLSLQARTVPQQATSSASSPH